MFLRPDLHPSQGKMEKEENLLRLWPHTQNSLKLYTGALRLGEYYENILM